jgi:hypothetical protein
MLMHNCLLDKPLCSNTQITVARQSSDLHWGASIECIHGTPFEDPSTTFQNWAMLIQGVHQRGYAPACVRLDLTSSVVQSGFHLFSRAR